jgi:hypothetical protein
MLSIRSLTDAERDLLQQREHTASAYIASRARTPLLSSDGWPVLAIARLIHCCRVTSEGLTNAEIDIHDKLMGQDAKKGERKQEEHIKKSRKAIHEKVCLPARVGKALPAYSPRIGNPACR